MKGGGSSTRDEPFQKSSRNPTREREQKGIGGPPRQNSEALGGGDFGTIGPRISTKALDQARRGGK